MEKLFQILAVILAGIAAFFWWRGNPDLLFLFAVLGAVSFFIGIRFQVGARVKERRAVEDALAAEEENLRIQQEEEEWGRRGEEEISEAPGLPPQNINDQVKINDQQRTTNN